MNQSLSDLRIVFMGTPAFAVASLEALLSAGVNIIGVVTAPDRPAGRGLQLQFSEVKKAALRHNLPLLQPEKLKDPVFQESLRAWKPDLQVVVAFRMLPESVWNLPPLGSINLHASLLPAYRGAAPINWAIVNGETHTGVTTFRIKQEIDTGGILLQEKVEIPKTMNAGELHDQLMEVGAHLVVRTVKGIADGTLIEYPQPQIHHQDPLPTAPKIFTETCRIDWNHSTQQIYNLIRGLSPYPGAFTVWNQTPLKIFSATEEIAAPGVPPGSWRSDGKSNFSFATQDGWIHVQELQPAGKKRMDVANWLRGVRLPSGLL